MDIPEVAIQEEDTQEVAIQAGDAATGVAVDMAIMEGVGAVHLQLRPRRSQAPELSIMRECQCGNLHTYTPVYYIYTYQYAYTKHKLSIDIEGCGHVMCGAYQCHK